MKSRTDHKTLYAMMAMMKCAAEYKAILVSEGVIVRELKSAANEAFKGVPLMFRAFDKQIRELLTEDDLVIWQADWKRDYLCFAAIFELMAGMDDQQRSVMEQFATELSKGNVELELKNEDKNIAA